MILDGAKGICSLHALMLRVPGVSANALAEPSEFIGVRHIPGLFVGRVLAELAMFEHCAGGGV